MSMGSALRFRLDSHTQERLRAIARQSGTNVSLLIRQAIIEYCTAAEKTGQLPISLRVEENHGTAIGQVNQNFTSGSPPRGHGKYKIRRPKK